MYAMAGSPMKLEITKVRKYVKNKGMLKPNDFHPNETSHLQLHENNPELKSETRND
jgi:hypothetical protein